MVVVLGFDAAASYVVNVLDLRVAIAFHPAVYLDAVAVLSPLSGIEVRVDVVLLVLPVLQEVLTEFSYLTE